MSQHLDRLITQSLKLVPQFSKCIQKIPSNNFIINYPLELIQQKNKCIFPNSDLFLKSQATIRPNNYVFLIEANQIFTSQSFTGATSMEDERLSLKLFNLKEKYEIFDSDMIGRMKLTLSIQANLLDTDLHLNQYAQYILKHTKNPSVQNYIKTHASSGFLKSVLNSNSFAVKTAYEYLSKNFLKSLKEEQFTNAHQIVRYYAKITNNVRVVFPFCNNLKHSFEPNCEIKSMFLMHRRQSFLALSSLKEIQPGECLTVNFGNQNNYELFVRYGFTIPNNPYSEFYLPIDFSDIEETFNSNIDWKMNMFKKNKKFKLKNFIRIDSKGNIHPDDLIMLKIIFTTENLNKEEFQNSKLKSNNFEEQIQQFVKNTGRRFMMITERLERKKKESGATSTKKPQNILEEAIAYHIRVIQNEQRQILQTLIGKK